MDNEQIATPIAKVKEMTIRRVTNGWVVDPRTHPWTKHEDPNSVNQYVYESHESMMNGLSNHFDWGVNDE